MADIVWVNLETLRGAVARLLTCTDGPDSTDALECDLAELLNVQPAGEPFTWRWSDHVGEGIGDA